MLKRFFQVSHTFHGGPSEDPQTTMNLPQPIGDSDKQRLVKLSDAHGKVCVSDWSERPLSSHYISGDYSDSNDENIALNQRTLFHAFKPDSSAASYVNAYSKPADDSVIPASQMQQYVRQQHRLRQVERKLRKTLSFDTIVGTTVVETAALFNARQVGLLQHDSDTNGCQQVVRYCQDHTLAWQPPFALTSDEFPTILQQLWQGKTLSILPPSLSHSSSETPSEEISVNADVVAQEHRLWLSRWPGNWLFVPVRKSIGTAIIPETLEIDHESTDAQGYWGLLALSLPERETWTQGAILAAHSLTLELSLALQQSQQYQELMIANRELQKLALSDGLTSLANRRRFDEHLADEWQRLARDQQPLSLILCDLDHFKRYNDTFGHPAGDRCLIRVARALLNGPQRPADLVARYGGEEFAIILPNTDTHGAWRIAQKIHESIRALQIDHAPGNEEPYVTVTMGVSTVIPGHNNTAQMLVQASDLALYHAKQQGRNRTYVNGHYNTVTAHSSSAQPNEQSPDVMPADKADQG